MTGTAPDKTELPYGLWTSPTDLTELFSQPSIPMYPFRHQGRLHWLQALPEEGGRIALIRQENSGKQNCLTAREFNIRTRVHEYGGSCFCLLGDEIIFNNFDNGRIYRQDLALDSLPIAVTPEVERVDSSCCFADLIPANRFGVVIAIMESAEPDRENENFLVAIDMSSEAARCGNSAPLVLARGSDFYACPVTTPDQTELAWLEWDNPCMPWDQSRLVIAGLSGSGATIGTRNRRVLVDSIDRAVCQPGFLDDHSLLFVSDGNKNDFWDFYHFKDNKIQQVTSDCYEYGEAHWVFGQRRWQGISPTEIIAVASSHDGDSLVQLAVNTGKITPLYGGFAECANLHASEADSKLLLVSRYPDRDAEIRSINPESGISQAVYIASSSHKVHGNSQPEPIAYPTRDGQQAYAYFYAPFNKKYCGPENSKPPLLVVVHGGPTSRATSALHPLKQYFTSLGYAVLDINHRGSTGYGRTYRQSLLGQWGEVDATDIVDGIKYVMDKGLADPDLVFIRGGSAGGYAVLRSLTRFPQMFSGGACYYGIGNLITLAEITHKFEGCYTDRLIGEKFNPDTAHNPDSRFTRRSPIFQMDRLVSPLILFQGLDDKVVPPAVSREAAELLGKKGIQYEYVEYENEGHGFRQLPTRVDSLKRETAFFSTIIQAKALSRQKRAGKSQQ